MSQAMLRILYNDYSNNISLTTLFTLYPSSMFVQFICTYEHEVLISIMEFNFNINTFVC